MTFAQYKRLVLVAIIPMLGAGWLLATILVNKYGESAFVTCENTIIGEHCRNIGWKGSLHNDVVAEHPSWFMVKIPEQERMPSVAYAYVTASQRTIGTPRIVSVDPSPLANEAGREIMSSLPGKKALIQLGMTSDERSFVLGDIVQLKCNELEFGPNSGSYKATCLGDGWQGRVTFLAQGTSEQALLALRTEVADEIGDELGEYRVFQLIMYPLFVYLFFIASGLVWLTRRAYRFVKG